jgi:small multidrug resistance pump
MGYVYLGIAIVSEVIGTIFLKFTAGENAKWWAYPIVAVGYVLSFWMLSLSLGRDVPLGIAYAIWSGVGLVVVSVASWLLFKETLTLVQVIGMVLIIGGVGLLELGARHTA